MQTNLSFAVVDSTSNSIVGGDFLFNYVDGVECVEHHHCMQPIVDLLRAVEAPVRGRLEASGDAGGLLYNFCLFVDCRLPATEHVSVCHFIESSALSVARHGQFTSVITNNTNPVTQVTHPSKYHFLTQTTTSTVFRFLVCAGIFNFCRAMLRKRGLYRYAVSVWLCACVCQVRGFRQNE